MKKLTFLLNVFLLIGGISVSDTANANSCFLATEDGSSSNCDSGTAQIGLPVHGSATFSKKGIDAHGQPRSTTCNNVDRFADKAQAWIYAGAHGYDKVTGSDNSCWKAECTYTDESTCILHSSTKTCCKNITNNTCWQECDLCRFNIVKNDFFPYATSNKLTECEIIGLGNVDAAVFALSDDHSQRNYKISGFTNLVLKDSWDAAWHCDMAQVKTVLDGCISKIRDTKMVKGYKTTSVVSNINYVCIEGRAIPFSGGMDAQFYNKFVSAYGCPLSAIKCDSSSSDPYKRYYNTSNACEHEMIGGYCSVVKNYSDYADEECWHGVRACSDFGHDDYKFGNYEALTCPSGSGTTKEKYLNKDTGEVVTLNDRECGVCECETGKVRFSECNSLVYEVSRNYFQATRRCMSRGYTLEAVSSNSCTACPYSAKYWRCD